MSQGKRINITPAARADLEDTYLERFYNAFDTLGSYEVGLRRDEIKTGVRSLPVARHAIWFFSGAEHVLIARVLHQARDVQNPRLWL